MLLKLPGMSSELADSIIDWRDSDSDVSPSGAESEYYLLLPEPYYCKDAAFETLQEIMLVNGASGAVLSGEDMNLNGVLDPNEDDADASLPADNRNGQLDYGLHDCVTVYSTEPNDGGAGQQKINVNQRGGSQLGALLQQVVGEDRLFRVMDRVRRGRPFRNRLHFYIAAGLQREEFEQIEDRITTTDEAEIVGRINIQTAPKKVLLCLPELEESDVEALMSRRSADDTDSDSIAWIPDVLSDEKAIAIGGLITTDSYQFSADVVAISGDGRAFRRCRMVVDAAGDTPRVVYWKDLTHLGWPLDPQIRSCLREGRSLEEGGLLPIQGIRR
jgi:hypothetical protein